MEVGRHGRGYMGRRASSVRDQRYPVQVRAIRFRAPYFCLANRVIRRSCRVPRYVPSGGSYGRLKGVVGGARGGTASQIPSVARCAVDRSFYLQRGGRGRQGDGRWLRSRGGVPPSTHRGSWRVDLFLNVRRFVSLGKGESCLHVFRARGACFRFARGPIHRTGRRMLPSGRRGRVGRAFHRSPGPIFNFRVIRFNSGILLSFLHGEVAKGTFPRDVLVNGKGRRLIAMRRVKGGIQVISQRKIQTRIGASSRFFGYDANRLHALLKDMSTAFNGGVGWNVSINCRESSFNGLPRKVSALALPNMLRKINNDRLRFRLLRFRARVHLIRPNYFRKFLRVNRVSEI